MPNNPLISSNDPDEGPDVLDYATIVANGFGSAIDTGTPDTLPGQATEWVSPREKHRRKMAAMALNLPARKSIDDLRGRTGKAVRLGTVEAIEPFEQAARDKVRAAYDIYDDASDEPGKARDVATKDAVVLAISEATQAVGALERAVVEHADDIFEALTSSLDDQRAQALEDLKNALESFGSFRATVENAAQFGKETGRWDLEWVSGPKTPHQLSAALPAIREAIADLSEGDDAATGRSLTTDYGDEFPSALLAKWQHVAKVGGAGSFAAQIYARALKPMSNDHAAREAIATRQAKALSNSNPIATADLLKGASGAPSGFVAPVDRSTPPKSSQRTAYVTPVGGKPMPYDEAKRQGLVD